jgi:hypothetical protein
MNKYIEHTKQKKIFKLYINSKLINLKYELGYILLKTANWRGYWAAASLSVR